MQHGPLLIANNLFLSSPRSILINSKGLAIVHNLITRTFEIIPYDGRNTPFHQAHSTELAGLHDVPGGDHRFYNNLFTGSATSAAFNNAKLPCFAAGNVFTKGTQPSKFDADSLVKPDFDPGMKLEEKSDGWYLDDHRGQSVACRQRSAACDHGVARQGKDSQSALRKPGWLAACH